ITLPGILQAQGYGDEISASTPWVALLGVAPWKTNPDHDKYSQPGNVKVPFLSQPPRHYLGAAWYQRDVVIPQDWAGRRVELFLEHPHWETTVWVDDKKIGSNLSLVAPHEYDLGLLATGPHRLTIRVDNGTATDPNPRDRTVQGAVMPDADGKLLVYRADGHSVSDALGAAWNGIVGRIELIATTPVWIDDAQVFPNVAQKSALVKVTVGNDSGQAGKGMLTIGNVSVPVTWDTQGGNAELTVSLGPDAQTWDEFHPVLQHLALQLKGDEADDAKALTFGLREVTHDDVKLLLNGREINFRGTHFGGDFPLTGYPPTDVGSWKKIFQVCKDYGLNGMRFHSWCPPEAAFEAADEMGIYLQPECGMWNNISPNSPMSRMLEAETERIVKAYGNHPSFMFLSPSNEPSGGWQNVTPQWAAAWYQKDPRRLYAAGTGWAFAAELNGPQYAVMPGTPAGDNGPGGRLRGDSAWFGGDWSAALADAHIPVFAHELGQWCAYPDYDVIKKFTGYLRPGNFEIFRDSMAEHGLLDLDKDFAWASGKYQLECYKEEIEANLRTANLAGFQLLDLHDYLGQGTALIGVLDTFWESKGYVTPEEFRRFCAPTVVLARFAQRTLTTADSLNVPVEVANLGPAPIANASPYWKITDAAGNAVAQGNWTARDIPLGRGIALGNIATDLSKLPAPAAYKLVAGLGGTDTENSWDFWLYPAKIDDSKTKDVLMTPSWDQAAAYLAQGGKVLFIPTQTDLTASGRNPPLDNVPVFWNRPMNPKLSAMLGLWIDAKSPALAEFPTEAYCNWQWTQLVRGVPAINLDSLPQELKPTVYAIDDWNRNWKLGVIFECKVGPGRLLVCPIDFQYGAASQNPVGQQLRRSLLDYMGSEQFQPAVAVSPDDIGVLWTAAGGKDRLTDTSMNGQATPDVDEGTHVVPKS
ncbi:MAG: sugar-binding domain-containing protein, partial [Opitutales bacterium]